MRSCLAFSICCGVAALLCDGIDGMVVDAERMADVLRRAAIRSDENILVVVCLCAQDVI